MFWFIQCKYDRSQKGVLTVSYTHLDVYKRQLKESTQHFFQLLFWLFVKNITKDFMLIRFITKYSKAVCFIDCTKYVFISLTYVFFMWQSKIMCVWQVILHVCARIQRYNILLWNDNYQHVVNNNHCKYFIHCPLNSTLVDHYLYLCSVSVTYNSNCNTY